jgi:hypothetical protein
MELHSITFCGDKGSPLDYSPFGSLCQCHQMDEYCSCLKVHGPALFPVAFVPIPASVASAPVVQIQVPPLAIGLIHVSNGAYPCDCGGTCYHCASASTRAPVPVVPLPAPVAAARLAPVPVPVVMLPVAVPTSAWSDKCHCQGAPSNAGFSKWSINLNILNPFTYHRLDV